MQYTFHVHNIRENHSLLKSWFKTLYSPQILNGTCRGKDDACIITTGKIVPTIGKCIGIMGGRIQFAPTIIREIL